VNGKLILKLSMFGLAMGVLTVFVIPSKVEPLFWMLIFIACAVTIARRAPGKYFLHGLCVSLLNSLWITAAHVLLFDAYIARHPQEAAMMTGLSISPRLMMLLMGPMIGLASGLILGLFALISARIIKPPRTTASL
jgi:hypothetical protein